MTESEHIIIFPIMKTEFMNNELTFSIGNIKSRLPSVIYYTLTLYAMDKTTIVEEYRSNRFIVNTEYTSIVDTFEISYVDEVAYVELSLISIGTSSENPLYFNHIMLNEGEYDGYHSTDEAIKNMNVGFNRSGYVNLYDEKDNFLQVIRPLHDKISLKKFYASECTVLCPHFADEDNVDDPVNLYLEFMNQREQKIDVLR